MKRDAVTDKIINSFLGVTLSLKLKPASKFNVHPLSQPVVTMVDIQSPGKSQPW